MSDYLNFLFMKRHFFHQRQLALNYQGIVQSQINLNNSINLFLRFFWSCTWLQAEKSGLKLLFKNFKNNFYSTQNEVNGALSGPKSTL